jgi:hypothetical protein
VTLTESQLEELKALYHLAIPLIRMFASHK